jgi:hypothetical protein
VGGKLFLPQFGREFFLKEHPSEFMKKVLAFCNLRYRLPIIRRQMSVAVVYGGIAVLALLFSPVAVARYSLIGAIILFVLLMIFLCGAFGIVLGVGVRREHR